MDVVAPRGVGVVLEASHLCMMMRGVEKQRSRTVTSALRGIFTTVLSRNRPLNLIGKKVSQNPKLATKGPAGSRR